MAKLIETMNLYLQKFKSISSKLLCAACATFFASSLPSGYNLGVVNTPQDILKDFCNASLHNKSYDLSPDQLDLLWSGVVSIFLVGAMIGSALSAWSSSLFGRRMTVILSSLLALTGAVAFVLSKLTDSVSLIIVGRVLSGIHCGLSSSLVPMYLMELSPCEYRQAVGILHCLGMTVGILIAQILGQEALLGTDEYWPYLLSLYALFILFGFILLINTPESPVYLFMDCENEFDALQGRSFCCRNILFTFFSHLLLELSLWPPKLSLYLLVVAFHVTLSLLPANFHVEVGQV